MRTQYVLTYNLYTGNGLQNDDGGFHIDALMSNGFVYRDVLTPQFDLQRCYYGKGASFRVPPAGYFFAVTPFDFTAFSVKSILIRVDPAVNVGRNAHC